MKMKASEIKIGQTIHIPSFSRWITVERITEKTQKSGKKSYAIGGHYTVKKETGWVGQEFRATTNVKTK